MSALDASIASRLKRDANGLFTAVVQERGTGQVLMVAWMDDDALARTLETREATYYSRSRGEQWVKGATSGHTQHVHSVRLDCDGDTVLLEVDQVGAACHTGDHSCFDADVLLGSGGLAPEREAGSGSVRRSWRSLRWRCAATCSGARSRGACRARACAARYLPLHRTAAESETLPVVRLLFESEPGRDRDVTVAERYVGRAIGARVGVTPAQHAAAPSGGAVDPWRRICRRHPGVRDVGYRRVWRRDLGAVAVSPDYRLGAREPVPRGAGRLHGRRCGGCVDQRRRFGYRYGSDRRDGRECRRRPGRGRRAACHDEGISLRAQAPGLSDARRPERAARRHRRAAGDFAWTPESNTVRLDGVPGPGAADVGCARVRRARTPRLDLTGLAPAWVGRRRTRRVLR